MAKWRKEEGRGREEMGREGGQEQKVGVGRGGEEEWKVGVGSNVDPAHPVWTQAETMPRGGS